LHPLPPAGFDRRTDHPGLVFGAERVLPQVIPHLAQHLPRRTATADAGELHYRVAAPEQVEVFRFAVGALGGDDDAPPEAADAALPFALLASRVNSAPPRKPIQLPIRRLRIMDAPWWRRVVARRVGGIKPLAPVPVSGEQPPVGTSACSGVIWSTRRCAAIGGRDAKPSSRTLRYSGCTDGAADLDGNRRRSRFALTRVSRRGTAQRRSVVRTPPIWQASCWPLRAGAATPNPRGGIPEPGQAARRSGETAARSSHHGQWPLPVSRRPG